jgi:hypothetical protein
VSKSHGEFSRAGRTPASCVADKRSRPAEPTRVQRSSGICPANAHETHVDPWSFCHWTPASNTERAVHFCMFRDAKILCGKLSDARFWRVFASLSGLCLGQSRLGQSPKRCACVAGWNVCTTRSKDVIRVAELDGDNLDDCLGVARLYFCALRNVEASSRSDCEPQSARPKITAGRGARCSGRTRAEGVSGTVRPSVLRDRGRVYHRHVLACAISDRERNSRSERRVETHGIDRNRSAVGVVGGI